jgi:hypothetical protein
MQVLLIDSKWIISLHNIYNVILEGGGRWSWTLSHSVTRWLSFRNDLEMSMLYKPGTGADFSTPIFFYFPLLITVPQFFLTHWPPSPLLKRWAKALSRPYVISSLLSELGHSLKLNTWLVVQYGVKYSITPLIRINWYRESSGYAENPDNWIFLWK